MSEITVHEINAREYAAFLDTVPHSAFHRQPWLEIIVRVFGVRLRLLGYFRAERLLAVTPLMGRRIGPFLLWGAPLRKCGIPAATPFCSPSEHAVDCLPVLNNWIRRHRFSYIQITFLGEANTPSHTADHAESLDNLELDLAQPLETIWRSLSQQKAAVRKAMRLGVRIHSCSSPHMLKTQAQLLRATYGKQATHPNFPASLYRSLFEKRDVTGLRVLYATIGDRTIGSIWTFTDSEKCYYWDAASFDEARELNANHLLVWCLIRWAHRRGYRTLDFVGTSVGGRGGSRPGIGRFKQSMGGRPVNYTLLYWYSPLMRATFVGYRCYSRLRLQVCNFWNKHHAPSV